VVQAFLQPIAAPSILGLFGFAAATFIVAAHLVGWYGQADTPVILAPFAAAFGGIGQVIAAAWGYKARDGIATAMHGAWACSG
jgi:succinate-acetate transporter protein